MCGDTYCGQALVISFVLPSPASSGPPASQCQIRHMSSRRMASKPQIWPTRATGRQWHHAANFVPLGDLAPRARVGRARARAPVERARTRRARARARPACERHLARRATLWPPSAIGGSDFDSRRPIRSAFARNRLTFCDISRICFAFGTCVGRLRQTQHATQPYARRQGEQESTDSACGVLLWRGNRGSAVHRASCT